MLRVVVGKHGAQRVRDLAAFVLEHSKLLVRTTEDVQLLEGVGVPSKGVLLRLLSLLVVLQDEVVFK